MLQVIRHSPLACRGSYPGSLPLSTRFAPLRRKFWAYGAVAQQHRGIECIAGHILCQHLLQARCVLHKLRLSHPLQLHCALQPRMVYHCHAILHEYCHGLS